MFSGVSGVADDVFDLKTRLACLFNEGFELLPVAFLAARDDGSGEDPLVCHGDMGLVAGEGCVGCLVPDARVFVFGFGEVLEVVFCHFLEEIGFSWTAWMEAVPSSFSMCAMSSLQ